MKILLIVMSLFFSAASFSQSQEVSSNTNLTEEQLDNIKQSVVKLSKQINEEGYVEKLYKQRAMTYFVLKEYEKSISDLTVLIDKKAENLPELYYYRGLNKIILDLDDGCEDIHKAKELNYTGNLEMLLLKCGS